MPHPFWNFPPNLSVTSISTTTQNLNEDHLTSGECEVFGEIQSKFGNLNNLEVLTIFFDEMDNWIITNSSPLQYYAMVVGIITTDVPSFKVIWNKPIWGLCPADCSSLKYIY